MDSIKDLNRQYEEKKEEIRLTILEEKEKTRQIRNEMEVLRKIYEDKMGEIIQTKQTEKMDLTEFYTRKIDLM